MRGFLGCCCFGLYGCCSGCHEWRLGVVLAGWFLPWVRGKELGEESVRTSIFEVFAGIRTDTSLSNLPGSSFFGKPNNLGREVVHVLRSRKSGDVARVKRRQTCRSLLKRRPPGISTSWFRNCKEGVLVRRGLRLSVNISERQQYEQ